MMDKDGKIVHSRDVRGQGAIPPPNTPTYTPTIQNPSIEIEIEAERDMGSDDDEPVEHQPEREVGEHEQEDSPPVVQNPIQSNPSKRVPVSQRWAMIPEDEARDIDDWEGPRSKSGRPIRSKLAMLASSASEQPTKEPRTAKEALTGPDKEKWMISMEAEIANIESKGAWKGARLPRGQKLVGSKWVFKIKEDAEGNVTKYKSRVVAQGYSQCPGVDYEETNAPVGRMTSLRILLAMSTTEDWEIGQADVEGAYLNSDIEETSTWLTHLAWNPKKDVIVW